MCGSKIWLPWFVQNSIRLTFKTCVSRIPTHFQRTSFESVPPNRLDINFSSMAICLGCGPNQAHQNLKASTHSGPIGNFFEFQSSMAQALKCKPFLKLKTMLKSKPFIFHNLISFSILQGSPGFPNQHNTPLEKGSFKTCLSNNYINYEDSMIFLELKSNKMLNISTKIICVEASIHPSAASTGN